MSDFNAIAGVTQTLENLLVQQLGIAVDSDHAPNELSAVTPLVGLFLYRVESNAFLNNLDWSAPANSPTQLVAPPFALNMHYLVTPYGPGQIEIQRTLGEVMRTFHEHAVVRDGDPALSAQLAGMTEELRIVPRMLALNDVVELWRSFEHASYRLAVTYEVSTVIIDSRVTRNVQRVQERRVEVSTLR